MDVVFVAVESGSSMNVEVDGGDMTGLHIGDPARLAAVEATHLLDTSAEEPFDRLARLAGSILESPWAFVTIVDDRRSFWKSCIGVDATAVEDRQNPIDQSFCQYVVIDDAPVVIDDARLDDRAKLNPSIELMNLIAWAGYPLRDSSGHVVGTLCVADTVPRSWTNRDRQILETLAAAVSSEIELRTLLEQAQVAAAALLAETDARRSVADRTARLATLARELSAASGTQEVAEIIRNVGTDVFNAVLANVAISNPQDQSLQVYLGPAMPSSVAERYTVMQSTVVTPIADAARTGSAVYVEDHATGPVRYLHLRDDVTTAGLIATAAVPLFRADGSIVGAVSVGWATPMRFSSALKSLLQTVAEICGLALERAGLADARSELVRSLQRELLPAVPDVEGLDIAVRYVPANSELGFGGDWYDVIPLARERTAFVVGDVCGHGIRAAARMALIRGAINALTRMHSLDLSPIFEEAEALLSQLDDCYIATLAVFVVDTATDTVRYISAGHPPAVLNSPDGTIVTLEDGRRPVLGLGGAQAVPGSAAFPPGATLVAYTDGLVENRSRSLDAGIAALAAATLASQPLDAEVTADHVLERLAPVSLDDVALILLKRT